MRKISRYIFFILIIVSGYSSNGQQLGIFDSIQHELAQGIISIDTVYLRNPIFVTSKKSSKSFVTERRCLKKIKRIGLMESESEGILKLISNCFFCHIIASKNALRLFENYNYTKLNSVKKIGKEKGFVLYEFNRIGERFLSIKVTSEYYMNKERKVDEGWLFTEDGIHSLLFPIP